MKTRKAKTETAIFIMAVLFIGIIASSCVTPHQIEEVRADIAQLSDENDGQTGRFSNGQARPGE